MARDPRTRPFRIALWAIYLTVVAVAVGLTIRSVVKNLRGHHRPPTATLPTRAALRVCVTDLEALQREQNERAWRLGDELGDKADAISRWQAWSREWEQRMDDLADRCRLDADEDPARLGGLRALADARDAILALHRAYGMQVNRFAQEDAALAAQVAEALERARGVVNRP
jgi:hypothetical protein